MLPNARLGDKGMPGYDVSALGARPGQRYPRLVPIWLNPGTDEMRMDLEYATLEPSANLPISPGGELLLRDVSEYVQTLIEGFNEVYELLIRHRDRVCTDCAPLQSMASLPIRFIIRPTQTYVDVLWKSFDSEYLKDGLTYSLCFEVLWRVAKQDGVWNLVEEEIRQLQSLDIPYFSIVPRDTSITVGSRKPIDGLISEPSWMAVISRLKNVSEIDRQAQEGIIRACFENGGRPASILSISESDGKEANGETGTLDFVSIAEEIAEDICRESISSSDGTITWVGPEYAAEYDQYRFQPLSPVLYGGKAGIAVFLAAVYHVTGRAAFRDRARSALRTTLLQLSDRAISSMVSQYGIGGLSGLGSLVYAFVRCGVHLRDEQLFKDAESIVTRIDPGVVSQDEQYDVVGGAAGWILALLALHQESPSGPGLERALESGAHLLESLITPVIVSEGNYPGGVLVLLMVTRGSDIRFGGSRRSAESAGIRRRRSARRSWRSQRGLRWKLMV